MGGARGIFEDQRSANVEVMRFPDAGTAGYLAAVQESIHGQRRKLLLFQERIEQYRERRGLLPAQIQVLDVGCGNGTAVTLPLGDRGYSVVGIDFHRPSIEYGRGINTLRNVDFILGDVESLPVNRKFDVVILSDILEHVSDPQKLLFQTRTVLKGDGILLISIPNGFGPYEVEDFLARVGLLTIPIKMLSLLGSIRRRVLGHCAVPLTDAIPYNYECGHVQFFSLRRFRRLLESAGYEVTLFEKGCVTGGPLTAMVISRSSHLTRLNVGLGKWLPYFLCSVWYFECRPVRSRVDG